MWEGPDIVTIVGRIVRIPDIVTKWAEFWGWPDIVSISEQRDDNDLILSLSEQNCEDFLILWLKWALLLEWLSEQSYEFDNILWLFEQYCENDLTMWLSEQKWEDDRTVSNLGWLACGGLGSEDDATVYVESVPGWPAHRDDSVCGGQVHRMTGDDGGDPDLVITSKYQVTLHENTNPTNHHDKQHHHHHHHHRNKPVLRQTDAAIGKMRSGVDIVLYAFTCSCQSCLACKILRLGTFNWFC